MSTIDNVSNRTSPVPLMSAAKVAGILGCSSVNVYMLAKRGELPSVVYGRCVRFHPDDVEEFIEQRRGKRLAG